MLVLIIAGIATTLVYCLPAIPQDPAYHRFATGPELLGTVHFWNLISNIGFFIVGFIGLRRLLANSRDWTGDWLAILVVLFAGVLLTGAGSAYYHWNPDNQSLAVDRLPMSVAFAAFFCLVVGLTRSPRLAACLLLPLSIASASSVLYWYLSELHGRGDLRPYILVQFLPIVLIPVLFWTRQVRSVAFWDISAVLIAYAAAKAFESYDQEIFRLTGTIGGHPFKHVAAAIGTAFILRAMYRPGIVRDPNTTQRESDHESL